MLAGVAAMAAGSVTLGAAGAPLTRLLDAPALPGSRLGLALSLLAVLIGGAAVAARIRIPSPLVTAAQRQLYANELLRVAVQRPLMIMSRAADIVERRAVDAVVDGVGRGTLLVARGFDWLERRGIDATVDGLARAVGRGGDDLRRLQSGRLYEYLRDATLGAIAVALLIALTAVT